MKTSRNFFLLSLLVFLTLFLTSITLQAQTLPAKALSHLKQNYSGYKLYSGDRNCKSRAVVSGNFNADGKRDYAVMFKKGRSGYVIAFLSKGTNYKAYVLDSGSASDLDGTFLSIGQKGTRYAEIVGDVTDNRRVKQRLQYDAPEGGSCESSSYFYVYSNGTFRRAFTSD